MFEAGLVQLIQSDLVVAAISKGGYLRQLPPGQLLPAWTHFTVSKNPNIGLLFFSGSNERHIQIDCYGDYGTDDHVQLASAIDHVLNGYSGTLPDLDSTRVLSCFQIELQDMEFDQEARTMRRMLEYTVWVGS